MCLLIIPTSRRSTLYPHTLHQCQSPLPISLDPLLSTGVRPLQASIQTQMSLATLTLMYHPTLAVTIKKTLTDQWPASKTFLLLSPKLLNCTPFNAKDWIDGIKHLKICCSSKKDEQIEMFFVCVRVYKNWIPWSTMEYYLLQLFVWWMHIWISCAFLLNFF